MRQYAFSSRLSRYRQPHDSGPGLAVVALIQSVELHGLLKRRVLSQSLILVVWPTTTTSSIASLTSMLAIAARVSSSISGTVSIKVVLE